MRHVTEFFLKYDQAVMVVELVFPGIPPGHELVSFVPLFVLNLELTWPAEPILHG